MSDVVVDGIIMIFFLQLQPHDLWTGGMILHLALSGLHASALSSWPLSSSGLTTCFFFQPMMAASNIGGPVASVMVGTFHSATWQGLGRQGELSHQIIRLGAEGQAAIR